jgi:predicted transcriptional regulator YdeE
MKTNIESFNIIGIIARTTNENEHAVKDIPELWGKFFSEKILENIPNKIDGSVYCIYTDYEKDFTKPYSVVIGCKVENLNSVPDGMIGKSFEGGNYEMFTTAKGKLSEVVIGKWMEIWNTDLQRSYTADFELYTEKSQNPEDAEVDIFIAVK